MVRQAREDGTRTTRMFQRVSRARPPSSSRPRPSHHLLFQGHTHPYSLQRPTTTPTHRVTPTPLPGSLALTLNLPLLLHSSEIYKAEGIMCSYLLCKRDLFNHMEQVMDYIKTTFKATTSGPHQFYLHC